MCSQPKACLSQDTIAIGSWVVFQEALGIYADNENILCYCKNFKKKSLDSDLNLDASPSSGQALEKTFPNRRLFSVLYIELIPGMCQSSPVKSSTVLCPITLACCCAVLHSVSVPYVTLWYTWHTAPLNVCILPGHYRVWGLSNAYCKMYYSL